nr:immunoglobulin heavy chain junction region [Mus musculus]
CARLGGRGYFDYW